MKKTKQFPHIKDELLAVLCQIPYNLHRDSGEGFEEHVFNYDEVIAETRRLIRAESGQNSR
jgi:hypothetical protein